ncbi:MAG: hypothetical protein IKC11_06380 [Clostridia bacterium]|nr:hypothetical protein [Clostridia bacterium]
MDYNTLKEFLNNNTKRSKIFIIGESVFKRPIYAVKFNFSSKNTVIIQGAIHAREHITTSLICMLIKDTERDFNKLKTMGVPNIIFVPMVNPDGVELCYSGLKSAPKESWKFLKNINGGTDFSLYKANARGVDLNTNFDAKWGTGVENKTKPSNNGFIGNSPMSEPEVKALSLLTSQEKPIFTISYHSKGQEIYYQFFNKAENIKRDGRIAKIIAKSLRYKVVNTEKVSAGGYKDWCVERYSIPSVTIEVGKDSLRHPVQESEISQIYKRNKNIIRLLAKVQKEFEDDRTRKVYERSNKGSKERTFER